MPNEDASRKNWLVLMRTLLLMSVTGIVVGLVVYQSQRAIILRQRIETTKQKQVLKNQIGLLKFETAEHNFEMTQLQNKMTELRKSYANTEVSSPPEYLKVYTLTEDQKRIVDFYVMVRRNLPVEEKLQILAIKLSEFKFDRHQLNISRVISRKGRKIAVIDLIDPVGIGPESPRTWVNRYFQGSMGGQITTATLVETLLQPGCKGKWVDGIEFYYNGRPIGPYDHVDLTGTFWRKDAIKQ